MTLKFLRAQTNFVWLATSWFHRMNGPGNVTGCHGGSLPGRRFGAFAAVPKDELPRAVQQDGILRDPSDSRASEVRHPNPRISTQRAFMKCVMVSFLCLVS